MGKNDPTRLSGTEHTVLSLLCDVGETYGLKLVEESKGELLRASIYVLLTRLERRGFVTSRYIETPAGEQGPRRRLYRVTGIGERALRAWEVAQAAWAGVTTS
jgi:DNA-binding PadR family transcriptional regulator